MRKIKDLYTYVCEKEVNLFQKVDKDNDNHRHKYSKKRI